MLIYWTSLTINTLVVIFNAWAVHNKWGGENVWGKGYRDDGDGGLEYGSIYIGKNYNTSRMFLILSVLIEIGLASILYIKY